MNGRTSDFFFFESSPSWNSSHHVCYISVIYFRIAPYGQCDMCVYNFNLYPRLINIELGVYTCVVCKKEKKKFTF